MTFESPTIWAPANSRPPAEMQGSVTREPSLLPEKRGSLVTGSLGSLGSLVTPNTLGVDDVERLGKLWGEDDFGKFTCPWPGHEGPAGFTQAEGVWMLACCSGHDRSLAEVWAARAYAKPIFHLSNIELATWWRRLAFDLGSLQPVEVGAPPLPEDADPDLHRARNGFLLLVGLRRVDHPPRPVPFSVRFASAWCSLTLRTASRAVRELRERGVILEVDRIQGRVRLYEPGLIADQGGPAPEVNAAFRSPCVIHEDEIGGPPY